LLAWALPLSLVSYLGLRGGGYDQVVNAQVAIAVWWVIFLIAALRLAAVRTSRAGWAWLSLLFAYAAWTTLSLTWTVSSENTMIDVSLMALYCGVALLAMTIRGANSARHMLHALGVAIVAVAVVALLSRLRFEWFSPPQTAQFLQGTARKLSYPLNYWNALAALMAMGLPLMLQIATAARSLLARALGSAGIPLLALCVFLTDSRGGAIEVAIALVVFVLLVPARLAKLVIVAICLGGSALLIAAANQRTAIRDGLRNALAHHQGDQLLVIAIAVMVAVGLLVAAFSLLERHALRLPSLSRSHTTQLAAAGLLICVAAFIVAGGPGFVSREWTQFKTPYGPANLQQANALQRLQNVTGNGRYQYWQAAANAGNLKPLTGTGAGTFVYWWAQHGTLAAGYVRDAHSLYIQALAELGYPGLFLIVGVIAWILLCGLSRVVRGRDPVQRLAIAAATASACVFAFSAAVEWIWLIPVLPVAMVLLAVVIFSPGGDDRVPRSRRLRLPRAGLAARIAGSLAALAVILLVALPLSATSAVRQSQSLVTTGRLGSALTQALHAVTLQPYAASPRLQEALVLERAGDLRDAVVAAKQAVARERTNWQTWFVLSRLEARTGHPYTAIADYLRARALDPLSPIFDT
jgi:hypothetical protein